MKIMALYDLLADRARWPELAQAAREHGVHGVVFAGNATRLSGLDEEARLKAYHEMLHWLGSLDLPVFFVPGVVDVPERAIFQAAINHELVVPRVAIVHGMPAFLRGQYVVEGYGGRLTDEEIRSDDELTYPLWRAEFALHELRRFDQLPLMVLHEGLETNPTAVHHLVKEIKPRVAIVGGVKPVNEWIGASLVVAPGRAADGDYAVIDLVHRTVQHYVGRVQPAHPHHAQHSH